MDEPESMSSPLSMLLCLVYTRATGGETPPQCGLAPLGGAVPCAQWLLSLSLSVFLSFSFSSAVVQKQAGGDLGLFYWQPCPTTAMTVMQLANSATFDMSIDLKVLVQASI